MSMLVCPYNKAHVVKATRFFNHILKCQVQHPDVVMNFCVFNMLHIIKPEDAIEHFRNCPDAIPHTELLRTVARRKHHHQSMDRNAADGHLNPSYAFSPINKAESYDCQAAAANRDRTDAFSTNTTESEYCSAMSKMNISSEMVPRRSPAVPVNTRGMIREKKIRSDDASTPEKTNSVERTGSVFSKAREIINENRKRSDYASTPEKTNAAGKNGSVFSKAREIIRENKICPGSSLGTSQYGSAFSAFTNRFNDDETLADTTENAPSIVWDLFPMK